MRRWIAPQHIIRFARPVASFTLRDTSLVAELDDGSVSEQQVYGGFVDIGRSTGQETLRESELSPAGLTVYRERYDMQSPPQTVKACRCPKTPFTDGVPISEQQYGHQSASYRR